LHLSEMGNGSLKEPHSYVKKGDRLSLRISHLEPEKRRVGFTQRWGTNEDGTPIEGEAGAPVPTDETADSTPEAVAAPVAAVSEDAPEAEPTEATDTG